MPDNAASFERAAECVASHPDPFIADFLARQTPDVAASFTPEQLQAIKLSFGARQWRDHTLDLRRSIKLFGSRFYVVLLAGRERRTYERLRTEGLISRMADTIVLLIAGLVISLPFLWVAYQIKSAMGIDLIEDGGVHTTLKALGQQINQLFQSRP